MLSVCMCMYIHMYMLKYSIKIFYALVQDTVD